MAAVSPMPTNTNTLYKQKTISTLDHEDIFPSRRCIWVNGPVIVGAGPSGLAVAAGLKEKGVPFVILERANCIASLWQNRTYDRLKLHIPKQFCQLPNFPFPDDLPEYPSKDQFINYIENYANHFGIQPQFNESVQAAKYDETCGLWRIKTVSGKDDKEFEYICRWIVVATGENAEKVVPKFFGFHEFGGEIIHACEYKSGKKYAGKKVLVVGCGNSGMEVSLDLCNHGAFPTMVVRSSVHILPKDILGKSTFEMAATMMKRFPLWFVDKFLVTMSNMILGETEKYGLNRPTMGPLQLKNTEGKTPVLDLGTWGKIKSGLVQVVPGIKRFSRGKVHLVNGDVIEIDSVVLATGYKSNVPQWLKESQESEFFSENGFPRAPFPNGWKGKAGLYAVGFTRRGLSGASEDAVKVAEDIGKIWKDETGKKKKNPRAPGACHRRCISQQF